MPSTSENPYSSTVEGAVWRIRDAYSAHPAPGTARNDAVRALLAEVVAHVHQSSFESGQESVRKEIRRVLGV